MSRVRGPAVGQREVPPAARRELLRTVADVLRVVHALHAGSFQADGVLPTVDVAAAVRARLEPHFTDLVDRLTAYPERWPL